MKPDVVTVALVGLAAYLLYCALKARQTQPRTYYTASELQGLFL